MLRALAQKTADKLGKFSDRDPNNSYGYGVPDSNNLAQKLLKPSGMVLAGVA